MPSPRLSARLNPAPKTPLNAPLVMKTKHCLALVVCLAVQLLLLSGLRARPVDLSVPPGGLGPTSSQGLALHWMELTELDFGGGLTLPLRFSFLSGRPGESQDFGAAGWRTPLFSSRLLTKTAADWPLLLPCGKIIHLKPQPANPKAWGTADGEWLARARGANTIVAREDGWEMEFDRRGLLIRLRTDGGRNILWSRDAKGGLIAVSELAGGRITATGLTVRRDAGGLVAAMEARTAFGLRTWKLGYDAAKRLERVTFPDGGAERCAYEDGAAGQPRITITSRALVKTSLTWDKETLMLVSDGSWSYSIQPQKGSGPLMTRTGPGGEFESYQEDEANGRVVFTAADGTATTRQKITASGPAKGKLETITRTPLVANVGRRRADSLPAPEPIAIYRATYDANGMLSEETDALGRKTTHQYLLFGASPHSGVSRHTQTDPLGHSTVEEFDRHGNLIAATDALGNVIRHEYDAQNRRVKTIGPDGAPTETLSYTPQGLIAARTDAAGNTTHYGYDQNGNVASITDALGGITRTDYDLQGNKISAADALGRVWKFENDAGGRIVRTFAPGGVETERRAYDDQGRVIAITDAPGNTTRTTYDALGRVTSRTDALDRVTKFSYDVKKGASGCTACNASAMATRITMPGGRTIERVYDADRRLIEERSIGSGTGQPSGTGAPPAAPAPVSITRHSYDLAGNLISTTDPLGNTTKFEYDNASNRVRTIHPDKTVRTAQFDAARRSSRKPTRPVR
jgi:YD repeat-containing protein